jgi:hypothetical protein
VLPTLAPAPVALTEMRVGVSPQVALPCAVAPVAVDDRATAASAAARCGSCPIASACLLEGLHLDAAWRRGEDPWGAYGVWGGVWFSPGHRPTVPAEAPPRGYKPRRSALRAAPAPGGPSMPAFGSPESDLSEVGAVDNASPAANSPSTAPGIADVTGVGAA